MPSTMMQLQWLSFCSNSSPTCKASILIKLYGRISDLDAAFKAANTADQCLLTQRESASVRVLVRCWMKCRKSLGSSPTLPQHWHEFCCVNLLKVGKACAEGHDSCAGPCSGQVYTTLMSSCTWRLGQKRFSTCASVEPCVHRSHSEQVLFAGTTGRCEGAVSGKRLLLLVSVLHTISSVVVAVDPNGGMGGWTWRWVS